MPVPGLDPQPTLPTRPTPPTSRVGEPSRAPLDVLVIGAGQAGLAVGHHLAGTGLRFLLVDSSPEVGHSWRTRWDSLRLFTPSEYSALPGMTFPAAPGTYPGKDQVADYLKAYAARFELPVMPNTRVERLDQPRPGGLFRVVTNQGPLWARQVVVATGPLRQPHIPSASGLFDGSIMQLHSAAYRNQEALPPGRVLVVGAGNSGLQIAVEISRTHEVHLAVGARPRSVPQRLLGRDLFWWLTRTGAVTRPASSPVAAWFRRRGSDLVIGTTWDDVAAAGITVHPRLTGAHGRTAELSGGGVDDVAAVVWATGFRPDYSWLDFPDTWDGSQLHHTRGRAHTPGLWFIGLPWQHTRGSALLGFVGADAAWVADGITSRHTSRRLAVASAR